MPGPKEVQPTNPASPLGPAYPMPSHFPTIPTTPCCPFKDQATCCHAGLEQGDGVRRCLGRFSQNQQSLGRFQLPLPL